MSTSSEVQMRYRRVARRPVLREESPCEVSIYLAVSSSEHAIRVIGGEHRYKTRVSCHIIDDHPN